MKGCRVAIVADDLTGALDAAAPFAARGTTPRVVVTLEGLPMALRRWGRKPPGVVAVNTESRHLPAWQAVARVERAVALLARLSPTLWFKKIDSTLRGHAVPESLAMSHWIERPIVVAPAVPSQGRITRHGRVHVHGAPLETTDFARDARSRPPLGALDTLFAELGHRPKRLSPDLPLPDGPAIVDAEVDDDLDRLSGELWAAPGHWLAVGASGLAAALARGLHGGVCMGLEPCRTSGIWLVVGSRSRQTQRQLERLREMAPDMPVTDVLKDAGVPPSSRSRLLIPGAKGAYSAECVAHRLGDAFVAGLQVSKGSRHLGVLTGGDIAMAVLQRLDAGVITVTGEWEPGVVLGHPEGRGEWPFVTKAGGFGDDELLVRLYKTLGSHTKVVAS
ncbi:four-carbon acid sugar kinase family protein [Halomonas sp. I1]|uniref:four-carbon acid sugar kinase family protein n=1 Tax=Halomonas sp. I1 TaxID=393536 RepID=UPI0028DF2CDF|nr:four-carbon acid sugar kinase family protein [Halomonas sp. I1]MDT8893080.1 four-carbon acid sugar kinase family protein [Halomonas sp. I1]